MSGLSTREKVSVLSDMVTGRERAYMRHDWSLTNGGISDAHKEATDCNPHHGVFWTCVFWLLGSGE
jgi:hypothetical protein